MTTVKYRSLEQKTAEVPQLQMIKVTDCRALVEKMGFDPAQISFGCYKLESFKSEYPYENLNGICLFQYSFLWDQSHKKIQ